MRIWLDDLRDPTDPVIQSKYGATGSEVWVKSAEEALVHLRAGGVLSISLDNDLGDGQPEGHTVASWIEEQAFHNLLSPLEVYVHSDNSVRAPQMRQAIQNAWRYWHRS
jgi:hypothetical protein